MTLTVALSGVYLLSCYVGLGLNTFWVALPFILVGIATLFLSKDHLWPENTLRVTLVVGIALGLLSRLGGKVVDPHRAQMAVSLAAATMGAYNLALSRRLRISTFAAYVASWIFVADLLRNILSAKLGTLASSSTAILLTAMLAFRELFQLKHFFSHKAGGEDENRQMH
ncbi:MAG: hypothetical protein DRP27_04725 [Thermotogae bacterium]|nr:MAG: hypothetical protein DRP27_04725 [Thermotogota bacterium]